MKHDVIERYIYDFRNARAVLADPRAASRHAIARTIVADVTVYCADHVDDVRATRARLVLRPHSDSESRAALATVDVILQSLRTACFETTAALDKAGRG